MIFGKQTKFYFIPALIVYVLYSAVWAIPASGNYYTPQNTYNSPLFSIEDDDFNYDIGEPFEIPILPPDTGLRSKVPNPPNNPLEQEFYSPLHLSTPPSLTNEIEYDPTTNSYRFQNKIGNTNFGPAASMSVNEYIDHDLQQEIRNYWREKGARYVSGPNRRGGGGIIPQLRVGGDVFETIFGSNIIDIRPSGNVELMFGIVHNSDKNPNITERMRKRTDFKFDAKIQLSLMAKIGDKISFNLNYNTESNFDFDNKMKLKYEGKEDDIIQLLEFGDVTLPLNSSLITGSQTLFGGKVGLKFGKLFITAVASETSSQKQTLNVTNGAQTQEFYFRADEYEDNRHFFIAQYFRDSYNDAMSELPLIKSNIVITKIEVWRTNIGGAVSENRNIVAFTDLGEADPDKIFNKQFLPGYGGFPRNNGNKLVNLVDSSQIRDISAVTQYLRGMGLVSGVDYEKVESARLLSPNEYTYNSKLGFISLTTPLNSDQVLAVAFQYQVIGDANNVYQVGEFSNEVFAPNSLRVKLLKSTNLNTKGPLWKLMMKNVYSIGGYQISSEKFRLNILFSGDEEGVKNGFFNQSSKHGIPLIRLMNLDKLNQQMDPYPDGIFDFIDGADTQGGTIVSRTGKIFFPTIEPFGEDLKVAILKDSQDPVADQLWASKYTFDSLYTMTKTMAQQYTSKNKYYLEGQYRSAYGAEYNLNAWNIPQGSVVVNAGGMKLTENVDYTVNYSMGTVSIINEGILKSGTPISISVENNSQFGMNKKRFFGTNVEYRFNENFLIGATLLNMSERPYTQKVNYGNEPINNTVWGMNFAYKTRVPWITKLVDLLPFHSTTAESTLQIEGEFAHFIPGHSRIIGKKGTTYIDDFEGARTTVDLRQMAYWNLASTPQGQRDMFPETFTDTTADTRTQLAYGFNRARLAWYVIDQLFYNNTSATPSNINREEQSKPYARAVYEPELFPKKEYASTAVSTYIPILNMAFYPTERGPYNYDVEAFKNLSKGINDDGSLKEPSTRWAGMMRKFDNSDFEANNYEYIEFWMMDPFLNDDYTENLNHKGGKLYFNLGDISEDILRDGKKFFEDGLPADGSDENCEFTVWGRVPTIQQIVNAFDNTANRRNQDVGYDGLPTEREREFFEDSYLKLIRNAFGAGSTAYENAWRDPSSDDFRFCRGEYWDNLKAGINDRYKYYNNAEGNSTDNFNRDLPNNVLSIATSMPNSEDINNDNTMNEDEKYYQWSIDINPNMMEVGQNYINDIRDAISERLPNGKNETTRWYQFRIPIKNPEETIGAISGLNSIRFLRVFLKGFEDDIILRFATFELVRNTWRAYTQDLLEDGDYYPGHDGENTEFLVGTVSLEENGNRIPINYRIPPGIEREIAYGGMQTQQLNEQSISMKISNLQDGDARAIYKNTNYDMRQFKRIEMFVHAEKMFKEDEVRDGDVTVFIRLGSDFTQNYYEYEIPAKMSPWYNNDTSSVWPKENRIAIVLDKLVDIKQNRRKKGHSNFTIPYSETIDGNKISVVGMPNLGNVTTIMIGVRNPKKRNSNDGDDMLPKSVEVWVNDLRLTGFDDRSGVAALGRMRLNLADLGDIAISGTVTSPGYGGLDQSVTQRQLATTYSIDFATNIDGGKILFPKNWNIKIPIHYDFSMQGEVPEYNPLNPDVKLKEDLKSYNSKAQRDSIRNITNNIVKRNSINFTNVRKERNLSKPLKMRPWDVENLDFSYAYSQVLKHDADLEFDNQRRHEGEIGYSFSHNPKNYKLGPKKGLKSSWLQIIRDLNITLVPKSFTFRTSIVRDFNEFKYRPKSQGNIIIDTSYVKSFNWMRNYSLQWDVTTSLKFIYNANATSRLEEPQGLIDSKEKKAEVWRSFGKGGLMNLYDQRFEVTYQIPINKIPLFNWLTANFRYSGQYRFVGAPISLAYLGNTIDNSNQISLNGQVNLVTLYNNIPYLKKINSPAPQQNKRPAAQSPEPDKKDKKKKKSEKDSLNTKPNYVKIIGDGAIRFLMMVRNVNVSWTQGKGTVLPGYMYSPNLFGINFKTNSPGFLYVFGGQSDIQKMAVNGNWITKDTLLNSAFQRKYNETLNIRAQVEPFKEFRIDVVANRTFTSNLTEYFRANAEGSIKHFSPLTTGNFNITYVGLKTFFKKSNAIFNELKNVRLEIAKRIARENINSVGFDKDGYPFGYDSLSQEVLTYSFMASYLGKNAQKIKINKPFFAVPLPNWQLRYNGLTKIKAVAKVFQNFSINHNYTCTYNIGSYKTNVLYDVDNAGYPNVKDQLGNFIPKNEITQISLVESFNPLIGFDMTLTNSLMIKVDYKQGRNLSLSFANNQITEMRTNELAISAGYRFKDLKIGFSFAGTKRQIVSDLNITVGFSMRDNTTKLRKIAENVSQISSGMLTFSINGSADYQISSMIGIRLFYNQIINKPYISTQYQNTNIEAGLSIRLMLTQ
ncbi:MAG: cell surface protein SprA [Bacteroidales bacterium]|nr:cell surface protein SprA [Bacteroidales bacterium]